MFLTILKKYWREILIILLVAVSAFSIKSCQNKVSDIDLLSQARDSAFYAARYYVDKNGRLQGQIKTFEGTVKQLREYGDKLGIDNDKLTKQVGNLNRLVVYYQGKVSMSDTIETKLHDTIYVDLSGNQIRAKWFKWNNEYLSMDGVLTDKTASIAYNYEIDFTLTAYRKKKTFKQFLRNEPGQVITDIHFSDPNMRVSEFKGFIVQEPKKSFIEKRGVQLGIAGIIGFYLGSR